MKKFIKNICEKYKIDYKFIKFLFVGAINTVFGYLVFVLFLSVNFHFSLAALLSTVSGILFNFKTTGIIVFKNYDNNLLFKFFGVYGITYLVNLSLLTLFNFFKFNMYIAGFVIVFPCALLSYKLMKTFVFNKKGEL